MADSPLHLQGTTLDIYRALTELKRARVSAVQAELERRGRSLAYTTVQTVLNRLEEKGAVATEREKNARIYRPLIPLARVRKARIKALVDDLYNGEVGSLVLHLMRTRKLSPSDLEELKALVAKHETKPRRGTD